MRRAAKVDANHGEIVSALRKCGAFVVSLAAVGGGVPDLLIWTPKRGYQTVEIKDGSKSPSERRLTSDQELFHSKVPVSIVESVEDVLRLMA